MTVSDEKVFVEEPYSEAAASFFQGNKMLERNFLHPSKMKCKWEGNSYKTNGIAVKTFLIVLTL